MTSIYEDDSLEEHSPSNKSKFSIMTRGNSVLAKGGGMSKEPVKYTFTRHYTNLYKNIGTMSSSDYPFKGLEKGGGLEKGHSILDTGKEHPIIKSGDGMEGTSLFEMEHYNPIEEINDDVVGGVTPPSTPPASGSSSSSSSGSSSSSSS
jgi:hypothetical protein